MTIQRSVGAVIVILIILFALFASVLIPGDPFSQSLSKSLATADGSAPFGYDHLGRSLYHRLAHALRLSPAIAIASVATAAVAGLALGMLAAARGGWIDRTFTLLADSLLALPGLLLVLMVLAIFPGTSLGFWGGLSLILWIEFYRMTRASARATLASPAVEASKLMGFGPIYLFRYHVWPEIAPLMLTVSAFGTATAIMAIAALGYVNVGMRAPTPELGLMMVELLPYWREAPWALLTPVISCFLLLLGLILIAGENNHGHA